MVMSADVHSAQNKGLDKGDINSNQTYTNCVSTKPASAAKINRPTENGISCHQLNAQELQKGDGTDLHKLFQTIHGGSIEILQI